MKKDNQRMAGLVMQMVPLIIMASLFGHMQWAVECYRVDRYIPKGTVPIAIADGDLLVWADGRLDKA